MKFKAWLQKPFSTTVPRQVYPSDISYTQWRWVEWHRCLKPLWKGFIATVAQIVDEKVQGIGCDQSQIIHLLHLGTEINGEAFLKEHGIFIILLQIYTISLKFKGFPRLNSLAYESVLQYKNNAVQQSPT